MIQLSKGVSFAYKVLRSSAAKMYYLRADFEFDESNRNALKKLHPIKTVDKEVFNAHKKMWLGWSASAFLSKRSLHLYRTLSGIQTPKFLPINVYFTTVNPILNNKMMAWAFAQKGNYYQLFGVDNEPVTILRNLNGLFFDFKGNNINSPKDFLETELKKLKKIIIKPASESWGGRNVLSFEKNLSGEWKCINNKRINLELSDLDTIYNNNYVIQEYLEQHPFYKKLNPTSFNTLRVYVYRSVTDQVPHVLHTMLRVGRAGSLVDNVKAGGIGFYVMPDGRLLHGFDHDYRRVEWIPGDPSIKLSDLGTLPGLKDIHDLALFVATKIPYSRVVAFDINIDSDEKPRLIELNTFYPGLAMQVYGFPFFGEFTDEVISYCKEQKKNDYLMI